MKEIGRYVTGTMIGYIALWYAGAMFNFFPFGGRDFILAAVGFTGFLITITIVLCACWIIQTIQNDGK